MPQVDPLTAQEAVARYEAVNSRLPCASFPQQSIHRAHLGELIDEIDCFVLDGFGVLNVGDEAVPGAIERVNDLKAMGKEVFVLTNGASYPATRTRGKYAAWGVDFSAERVVSSRDALARSLAGQPDKCWGFAALDESELDQLVPNAVLLKDDPSDYERSDGFVLLGTGGWTIDRQALLHKALISKPRPLLVGNPDLVAPHTGRLSMEPGFYAHALADAGVVEPEFFGKPFDNAFAIVREGLATITPSIEPHRIAMVGDTLHTDILGGAQAGWRTVLVTDHGLFKGLDVNEVIDRTGIRPDFIVPTT